MLHELDQSLAALLKSHLPGKVGVSFATPDDRFAANPPAIDLFLYDIRENAELRISGEAIEYELRDDRHVARRRQPPIRIDASYLITAWAGVGGEQGDASEDELRLLSAAMRVLLAFPRLPRECLVGSLAESELPLPVAALQSGRLQSLGEFWQALGGKPKAALNYTVTLPVQIDEGVVEPSPLVFEKQLVIKRMPAGEAA